MGDDAIVRPGSFESVRFCVYDVASYRFANYSLLQIKGSSNSRGYYVSTYRDLRSLPKVPLPELKEIAIADRS